MVNWKKRDAELDAWCEARGLQRLPDSSYEPGQQYLMAPVRGLKCRVRVVVTGASYAAMAAKMARKAQ